MLETPSSQQGKQFQNYLLQNYNERFFINKEGFDTQSKDIFNKYQQLHQQRLEFVQEAVDRTNPNANPYLNKTVRFTTGELGYVTNKGVLKYIPTEEIFQNSNVPKNYISLSLAWDNSWKTGAIIPTTPSLILGEPLIRGQEVGNEGSVVYVKDVLEESDTKPSYVGCYADNYTSPQMTFLGEKPVQTSIQNGNFDQPILSANSYQYYLNNNNNVPSWIFNAVLVNQSQAWGFPMPYPSGSQCAVIQGGQNIQQILSLQSGVDYTLEWLACGRNCCTNPIQGNLLTIALTNPDGTDSKVLYSFQSEVNAWNNGEINFTVSTSGNYALIFQGTATDDNSTALQNIRLTAGSVGDGVLTSWEECRQKAIENGYQYFALQESNITAGTGYCAVSNSLPSASYMGNSNSINKMIALWSSNTTGSGNYALLSKSGTLNVINNDKTIYSTPNDGTAASNYIGCYTDQTERAIPLLEDGNSWNNNYDSAFSYATTNKMNYFSIQAANNDGYGQAGFTNDLAAATKYGKAANCKEVNGYYVGGGWTNAIYSVNSSVPYYFIVLDNGNMEIHRGSSPDDDQGILWQTNTTGKQQMETTVYRAEKGKFAKNWCPVGGTLMAGEFIGSPSGNMALIMGADGSLVLYTFQTGANCQKMPDGNMGGGTLANAVYNIGKVGVPQNLGTLAYIDADSFVHPYSSEDTQITDDFIQIKKRNILGADIAGTTSVSNNLVDCKNKCIGLDDCVGIIWDNTNNICYPKNDIVNNRDFSENTDLYVRQKKPIQKEAMTNIDSYQYQKYSVATTPIKKNNMNISYLKKAEEDVNNIAKQYSQSSATFRKNIQSNQQNMLKAETELDKYIANYQLQQHKMKYNKEMIVRDEYIVSDSNIVVSERNYEYILWCAVAVGVFLVGGNILKQ
jgi:hypothetical protein